MTRLPDAIAISETKLNSNSYSNISIPNYNFFHSDSPTLAGGLGIYLKDTLKYQSINQFSGPAYPWGVAGAAAQVGASKHLDPLQQRIDALLGCQGETN